MRKKTKFKSHLSDFFIVLVCLSVCAVSLYFFWRELNHSTVRNDKEKIATIYFKQKIAQRQFDDSVVWERLSQNSPLYNKDTIYTSDFSQAIVKFNDGTQLELNENTMLKLSYSEKGVEINVSGGDIQIDGSRSKSKKELAVSMQNGTTVKLDSGSTVSLKSDAASGVNNIEVQGGTAKIETKNGDSGKISSGESINIEETGATSKNPITVTSISKNLNLLKFDEKEIPVKLEWKLSEQEKNQKVIVQISAAKDFSKITKTYTPSGDNIEIPASSGTFYWRIFTENEEDKPAVGKISVKNVAPVEIISPAAASEFRYRNNFPSILLSWNGSEYADHYKIEISTLRDMKNIIFSETVNGNSFSVKSLSAGEYFWRVTPFFALNDTGYASPSEVKSFSVVKNEQIKPPALSIPVDGAKLTYTDSASNSFDLQFAWKSEIKNAEFNFEISRDKDFSDIFYSEKIENSTFLKKNLGIFSSWAIPDGTYFWRVVRISGEPDDVTPQSNIQSFSIKKIAADKNRLVYPPENFSAEPEQLLNTKFVWKLADDFKDESSTSVLQISKEKDFSKIEVEKMISAKENLEKLDDVDLPSGIYFWRVGVESKNGEKIGFSDSRTLNILKKLSLPEVILPSQNSMSLTYAEKSSHFVWKNSDGADYYNIKITDKNGKIIAEKSGIKENSANFVLPPEKYNVSVQAFSEETVVSPMRASSVSNVSFALRNPVPVELIFPNSLEKIDGLSAIRMPTVFLWKNEIDIHAKSEFVLYRISSDGTEKKVYSVLNPKNEVKIERLTEGNYRWQILASTADGIPLDSSKNTFSVSKIPLLQNVTLLQPENNFVIGNSYLKNNRFITFSWKEISGATDYKFALYQKFADGSAKLIYSENTEKTEIQIKKQNFDIGDFEWSVSAFCHAKDGYEEQHSRVSTGIFKIRVELPGKIRLIKPGKMYAK
ncbi:MAG: hypothetical protein UIB61_09545 [Treponema sp.]|nr:hypothetical protein [Treponema sp.]